MEIALGSHAIKIENLETMFASNAADEVTSAQGSCQDVTQTLANLQVQADELKRGPAHFATVVDGLAEPQSLQTATHWLSEKLKELGGPMHIGTFVKAAVFQGLIFAKFCTSHDDDIAATLLAKC